jgi:NADH-quinone oxidoreductase subunit N
VAAIVQTDVKRMLAYSSISHAGYVLIAVQAASARGTSAALFYVLTYALMTIGAFACVAVIAGHGDDEHALSTYRGLARRQPLLAGTFSLFLLAQAGMPLTGGFVAKLSVFSAAVAQGQYVLALIGMIATAIAAYVYLRIILAMYAPADDEEQPADTVRARVDYGTRIALAFAAAAVLFLGIMPGGMLDFARHATQLLSH